MVAKAALERTTKRLELAAEAAAKEAKELHEDFFGFVPSREHIAGLKHALARTEAAELTKENDKQVKEALKALNQAVTAVTEATGEEHVKAPHDHRHEYVERGSLVRILKSKDVRLVKPEYLLSLHEAGEIIRNASFTRGRLCRFRRRGWRGQSGSHTHYLPQLLLAQRRSP